METWGYVYLAVVTIVMVFLAYRYADLSLRVRRQRKRYDLLLRGRGELNIEELLRAHSHDIELAVRKIKLLEDGQSKLDSDLNENKSFLDKKFTELNNSTNTTLISKLDGQSKDLGSKISTNFTKSNDDITKLNNDISNRIKNLDADLNNKIKNLDEKYNKRSNNIDAKFTNEVEKINKSIESNVKKLNEKHDFDYNELKKLGIEKHDSLLDYVNKKDKSLDENISFAIQQVSLHKYNAFKNQSGDLSFTMVLLDRMYNGVMLTSINARDASYTYTKEVKNGKCDVDISPEEEKALNILVKKN